MVFLGIEGFLRDIPVLWSAFDCMNVFDGNFSFIPDFSQAN